MSKHKTLLGWTYLATSHNLTLMKFSIITPVYNGEKYIAETIETVLSQEGDFEIEYIIQDGASTDKTPEIIKSYDEKLKTGSYPIKCKGIAFTWFSEKDSGMYDAIEKGFARATGDIYAYINADDLYVPDAFLTVATVFKSYPEIVWAKGTSQSSDENGTTVSEGVCRLYRQEWLREGIHGRSAYFVDQESVFWRRSLWKKAQPHILSWRLAGDYALWITFAHYAPLWSFNKQVSIFRRRPGQLSAFMGPYREEQEKIAPRNTLLEKRAALFFSSLRFLKIGAKSMGARVLFAALFPFTEKWWYIDFDRNGRPIKKSSASYIA